MPLFVGFIAAIWVLMIGASIIDYGLGLIHPSPATNHVRNARQIVYCVLFGPALGVGYALRCVIRFFRHLFGNDRA